EGHVAHLGPIIVRSGQHTGRAAKDKYVVKDERTAKELWWNPSTKAMDPEKYDRLRTRMMAYLQGNELFVQDTYCGNHPKYRLKVRVTNETAWHNLFVRNMFVRVPLEKLADFKPEFTIIHAPSFMALPDEDGVERETFVAMNLEKMEVLIGGTAYAGEQKKSAFTVLNYLLPLQDVLSMHASANVSKTDGKSTVFFGLSGTGKTTLSTDPDRLLVGDDEIGWCEDGIFNFEGGCYAKVIRLSAESEPQIHECTRKFGTILENVMYDAWTRRVDLDDSTLTQNTRASYPVTHIPGALREGRAGHPNNIIMLTCDAFGVMPPIAKLTPEQAMYHFMSGYTAKVAGTEKGVTEPMATFSACFGQPFMMLHPYEYAKLLAERMKDHKTDCWLINTGWSGGPYGTGERMPIKYSRAVVHGALSGKLRDRPTRTDPFFGFEVPTECEGVPADVLDAKKTWKDGAAYDAKAKALVESFKENFKEYAEVAPKDVIAAGPK
ncbi:MAG: phosphoenolpyruvate carboxykinase (ATP), partial [Deltaproteobacteria bacterium]|nr:phosphoenolpyruvate carboxykinase (ATP) [Deltaproteobacteria bacterium]